MLLWKFRTYYINIVNCQIMPTPKYKRTGLGFPMSGEAEGKKERKIILKWGKFFFYVILDREILTYRISSNKRRTFVIHI